MQRGAQRERDVIDIAETLICLAASSSFLPGRSWKWKPMSTCLGQATGREQGKRERGMGKGQGAVASGNRSRWHAWALFTGNQSLLATCLGIAINHMLHQHSPLDGCATRAPCCQCNVAAMATALHLESSAATATIASGMQRQQRRPWWNTRVDMQHAMRM